MILGVNLDHIATLRQARLSHEPDPVLGVILAVLGGADGITVHLREDRRHIQDRDLRLMREVVKVELNLEMAATTEMLSIARDVKPDLVTLVPEKRQEITTEGGLDVRKNKEVLRDFIKRLNDTGIPVSLFINPDPFDIEISREIGTQMVEIHTGMYANARGNNIQVELKRIKDAVRKGIEVGLLVNAGHGLNYHNVKEIASIEGLRGLYIGHSIIARAVFVGLENAVREMKRLIESSRR